MLSPSAAEPSSAPEVVAAEPRFGPIQAWSRGLERLTASALERAARLRERGFEPRLVPPIIVVLGLIPLITIGIVRIHQDIEVTGIPDATAIEGQESPPDAAEALVALPDPEPAAIASAPTESPSQDEAIDGEELWVDGAGASESTPSPVPLALVAEPTNGVPEAAPSSAMIVTSRMVVAAEAIDSPGPAKPTFADAAQSAAPDAREPGPVPAAPVVPAIFSIPRATDLGQLVNTDIGGAPGFAPSLDLGRPELSRDLKSRRHTNAQSELPVSVEDVAD
jgi:hypothetical protein